MQHTCSQCGSTVGNDSPFCSNCGAAQVRFAGRSREHSILTIQETAPAPAPGLYSETQNASPDSSVPATVHSRAILRSAIYGGAVGAFLSAVPFTFLVALPLAGFLAVLFYRRRMKGVRLTRRFGFRLGALTGVFSYTFFILLAGIENMGSPNGGELKQEMLKRMQLAVANNPDPQAKQLLSYVQTTQGLAVVMICGMVFMLLVFALLAGVSGAVSAEMLGRRRPPN